MADWSMLPDDLLYGIAMKLDSIEDFVYFSAVCHSWNSLASLVKPEWSRANNPTTPWLLLPASENKRSCRKVFSLGKNKCYELELPESTVKGRCRGTAYGWIVMLNLDQSIQLYNPITIARLNLPSLLTMPGQSVAGQFPEDPDKADDWFQKAFLHRFIVLKMPQKKSVDEFEFVVMAIYCPFDHLAFARPGDEAWTPVYTSSSGIRQVSDLFIWKELVLILYIDGALAYCDDINGTDSCNLAPIKAKDYLPTPNYVFGDLVEGVGELYMGVVLREKTTISHPKVDYYTCGLEVYKLDDHSKSWAKVDELGDYLLFVGNNTPMAIHKSDAPNCIPNAIYFTDDEIEFWEMTVTHGHDMGVYDMTSREIKKFYQGDDTYSTSSPPILFWLKF